jgi:hypothetical protein
MMTLEQLTLDGGSVPYPIPKQPTLTERQRDLLLVLTAGDGPMRTRDVRRFYADASGALRRLQRLGLVTQVSRGWWWA